MNKYHIIPIGPNCEVAITLRAMKLRTVSYPWDWVRDTSIQDVIDVLKDREAFQVEEWSCFKNMEWKMPHDYKEDTHNATELIFEGCDLLEKYRRRFKRLFEHLSDGLPTYLLRFGDMTGLDKLKGILPDHCKIIAIENGRADCQKTHLQIISNLQININSDPYYHIINTIINIYQDILHNRMEYPITYDKILTEIERMNKEIQGDVSTLIEYNFNLVDIAKNVFSDTNISFESSDMLLNYTYTKILELTGIEYTLL